MEHKKIERINELARKQRTIGLSSVEVEEQAALRQEYLKESGRASAPCWRVL